MQHSRSITGKISIAGAMVDHIVEYWTVRTADLAANTCQRPVFGQKDEASINERHLTACIIHRKSSTSYQIP